MISQILIPTSLDLMQPLKLEMNLTELSHLMMLQIHSLWLTKLKHKLVTSDLVVSWIDTPHKLKVRSMNLVSLVSVTLQLVI